MNGEDVILGDDEAAAARPFHPKRSHRKSRLGCLTCKKRKVKCDEARPVCKACGLRNTKCEWPDDIGLVKTTDRQRTIVPKTRSERSTLSPTLSTDGSSSTSSTINGSSSSSSAAASSFSLPSSASCLVPVRMINEPMACLPSTSQEDMKLLWFFTANTSRSFVNEDPSIAYFGQGMQTAVVQEALENPFLMKSVFALSNQHRKFLGQEIDSSRLLMDRAQAYRGYRQAIEEAQPRTFSALLANSLILELLSAENFRDPTAPDMYILDWAVLWRGIKSIVDLTDGKSSVTPAISQLFSRPHTDLKSASKAVPETLLTMVAQISPDQDEYQNVSTYLENLVALGSLYDNLPNGVNSTMAVRIVTWLTIVSDDFVKLAREKRPMALVIISYYGVFLKLLNNYWWIKGAGDRIIKDISKFLGPAWHNMLLVPLQAMVTENPDEIIRILLSDSWMDPGIFPNFFDRHCDCDC